MFDINDLYSLIKSKRDINDSTIFNYIKNIQRIYKTIHGNINIKDYDFLLNYDQIIGSLDKYKDTTKKTYLASIVVIVDSLDDTKFTDILIKYRALMQRYIEEYDEINKKQIKSIIQSDNWCKVKDLKKVIKIYYNQLVNKKIFKSKNILNNTDKNILQYWLIANLYVGDLKNHPPIRLEYGNMKVLYEYEYNKLEDKQHNYLVIIDNDNKYFSLGDYKTFKKYGIKIINLSKKINKVLNKYLKVNHSTYLLTNNKYEMLTTNGLSKMIDKTFEITGLHITVNLIRHIFLSEFNTSPELLKKINIADKMCNSVGIQDLYKKV